MQARIDRFCRAASTRFFSSCMKHAVSPFVARQSGLCHSYFFFNWPFYSSSPTISPFWKMPRFSSVFVGFCGRKHNPCDTQISSFFLFLFFYSQCSSNDLEPFDRGCVSSWRRHGVALAQLSQWLHQFFSAILRSIFHTDISGTAQLSMNSTTFFIGSGSICFFIVTKL